jgi:adenylyltransferase/sulfurtransferase
MEGQVLVYRPEQTDAPCYRCLYRSEETLNETCSQSGVLAPLLGIIGSIQATETLKLLIGIGETLTGRLLLLDAVNLEWQCVTVRKNPQCPVCSQAQ